MDTERYLSRIGIEDVGEPDLETLETLQRAHLTAIPFENLHVYAGRDIHTDPTRTVPKLIEDARGGWCFELNGAFGTLLRAIGFDVRMLGAFVLFSPDSPMETHMTLEVTLDRPYLVDVGFGDTFIRPLPLDDPGPHDGGSGLFGFRFDGDVTTMVHVLDDGTEEPQLQIGGAERLPGDFDEASAYLRTNPELTWTKSRFATRLLDGGPDRVTLLEDRLKFKRDGTWTEREVSAEEWSGVLVEWFGLTP